MRFKIPHLPKIILFIRSISLILYPKIMLIVIKNLDELIVFNFSLVWIKPYTMKRLHIRNTQCLFQKISIFLTGGFSVSPLTPQDFPSVQYSAQIHASEPTVGQFSCQFSLAYSWWAWNNQDSEDVKNCTVLDVCYMKQERHCSHTTFLTGDSTE